MTRVCLICGIAAVHGITSTEKQEVLVHADKRAAERIAGPHNVQLSDGLEEDLKEEDLK